jgi:ADP-heptose:LPS heptosyltransferase
MPGTRWFSLQHDRREALPETVTDLAPSCPDFVDTTAAIHALDLVITVDTSIAHLAGALGKPVWILLPFAPDWRWMMDRSDSPWYSSARLFRQSKRGDWAGVVGQVAASLAPISADWQSGD